MTRRRVLATTALIAAVALRADAAEKSGIAGTVTAGSQSAPIANAQVSLRGGDHRETTQTDAQGHYQFAAVRGDVSYSVTVEAEGLRAFTKSDVVARDGEIARVDVNLELADVHYAVVVGGEVIDLRGAGPDVSRRVDARDFAELPSVTRSTTKYALLDPHVRQTIGLGADFADASRISINAGSYRHTGYMLDGASTYDWIYANAPQTSVSPGAVQELKVLTGQYSAQYGLSTTGVVALTTPAGGDHLRGEGFVFFRPSGLQSPPPLSTFDVPNERTNAGLRVGGPLRATRTYFFASYERADQDRGAYIQSPTPAFFTGESREQYGLARVDHSITARHALTVRFNASEYTTNNANDRVSGFNQPSFGRQSHSQSIGGQASERALLGNAVNELRVSITAYTPDSATPLESSVQMVRPNYATTGFSTTNWVDARTVQAGELFALRRGRHDLRFGGEYVRLDAHDYSYTPFGTYTFAPGPPAADDHPLTFSQTFGAADLRYGQKQVSAFAQDELRIAPRLTASLGLRYEVQSITDARTNFAPRAGLTWDATGDGKTVVRGGAGIFYDQYYMYLTRRYMTLGPLSPQASYSWSWGDPAFPTYPNSFTSGPQGKAAGSRDIMIADDEVLNPYSRQVSLSVDRELRRGLTVQASGLYSHTYKQMRVNDINHPVPFDRTAPNQVRTPQAANLTRPYTTYEGVLVRDIALVENTAATVYKSLDLGATWRLADRGQLRARYVWSASIAHSMFYADANSGVPNEWWDDWDRFESGPGDFHQPHRFVADGYVGLPFDSQVAVVTIAASGLPVNPITGRDNNGDSYTVDRPIGLDRNSFRGPAQLNVDLAASKRVRVSGAMRVEGRLEVFNLFNRSNFIKVNNIYGEGPAPLASFLAPVAGITNADPSRQIQFAFKLIF
jgi:Carboxypeptidase regulatory-like domain/TonB dependent receptor-like, beta-barrel